MDLEKELANETEEDVEEKQPRYIIRDAKYIMSPHPPVEWVIEKLIHERSVSIFYGEPGAKKTWALLSLAVNVALGKAWLGLNAIPTKVLIVDEEAGEEWMASRLSAAIRGELGNENIQVEFVSYAGFKLDNKEDTVELEQLITERQAGLVIIDALTDCMVGDENSKQDTQPVFTTLKRIATRTNAAIILIHHSNKAGGYRGSSAIKGAIDLLIKVESDEGSNWIHLKSEKTRNIEATRFTAVANWTEDQFYLELAENQEKGKKMSKSQSFVIRYLTEHGPSPLPDIMGAADSCTSNAARQAVYSLVDEGRVYRTNPDEKGRGTEAIYDLVDGEAENE
jgi:RecA-family ATPase